MPIVDSLKPVTLVVAGTFDQFRLWQSEDKALRRDARFVYSGQDVRGYSAGTTVRFVGTYYERKDLSRIMQYVGSYAFNVVFEKST